MLTGISSWEKIHFFHFLHRKKKEKSLMMFFGMHIECASFAMVFTISWFKLHCNILFMCILCWDENGKRKGGEGHDLRIWMFNGSIFFRVSLLNWEPWRRWINDWVMIIKSWEIYAASSMMIARRVANCHASGIVLDATPPVLCGKRSQLIRLVILFVLLIFDKGLERRTVFRLKD